MIAPTTPTGSWTTSELPIVSSVTGWAARSAYPRRTVRGRPAWTAFATLSGVPSSSPTVRAISPARPASASCSLPSTAPRSAIGVSAQPGNAARAAATARSTSSAVPAGTWPMISSVAGFSTGIVSSDDDAVQAPSR